MAKRCKTERRKWNKKGAALAYTLIATMVLMILSTSLFTAAGYNISLTTKNDNARQSYITCKSAVEYAKSHILQQAQAAKAANKSVEEEKLSTEPTDALGAANTIKGTTMAGFSVKQDSASTSVSGFKIAKLDDKSGTNLATCTTTLTAVTQTLVQAVTTCTKNSDNTGYTVTVQSQTITNTLDPTKGLSESGNITKQDVKVNETQTKNTTVSVENKTEILFVRYVFTYHIKITASSQYSTSDTRSQQLNYETDCTIGGSDNTVSLTPSPIQVVSNNSVVEMFAVGGQYGGSGGGNGSLLNSNDNNGYSLAPGAASDMAVVFKRDIHATGNSGSISAPSVFFMSGNSLTVGDISHPKSNGNSATITSNFVYFNGNIQGTKNDRGSWLILNKRDKNSVGIVQFNNTTITLLHPDNSTTKKDGLNGLYYFKDGTDLFDFDNFDKNVTKVPETDYAAISSIANQDYVNYLKSNIDNIVSGEIANGNNSYTSDFAGWVGQGRLGNGTPSTQTGKTVYCYASDCQGWGNGNILDNTYTSNYPNYPYSLNTDSHPYSAKNIIFSWVGNSALEVPGNRTATFQADYIAISTNQQAIWTGSASSRFLVKSVNGKDPLTMVFPTDTVIRYNPTGYWGDSETYTITAGTYSKVPTGTNLFSSAAETFFKTPANHTYDGVSGSVKYGAFTGIGDKLADATAPNFLLYGAKYGNQPWVYNNVNTPGFIENTNNQGHSAYPVLFNQPMQISSGKQDRILSAPQVYFMGTGNSIYGYDSGNANLYSDFIYYAGNSIKSWNGYSLKLHNYSNSKKGVIYFAQQCTIYNGNFISLTIPKGYYYFNNGIDLFNLNVQSNYGWSWWGTYYTDDLSNISQADIDKIKKDNYVDYIEQQHSNIISGDTTDGGNAPTNAGANWAPNGVLNAGAGGTFSGKDAYLYVNDASKWGTAAVNYQASRINLQYVSASPLSVPAGKEVTFTADNLSLNGQETDASQTSDSLILQQGNEKSKFIVNTLSGTGYVNVTLPHDLTVKMSDGVNFYKVPAGVYKVKNGTNLFDYTPSSGNGTTITPNKIQIDPVKTFFNKGKYTNENE